MKTLLTYCLLLAATFTFAQDDCKPYLPGTVGDSWEITSYSKKDKVTGTITYEILSITESDSTTTYEVQSTFFDEKGEQTYQSTYEAMCENGVFHLDMTVMMDGNTMAAYESMEVEVDATEFEVPEMNESAIGPLEDGTLKVKIASNGVNMMTMTVNVTDREIESLEEVTTEAGTFECLKMTQTVNTRMIMKIESSSIEWYSEGIGMVRSESYNKNGKLTGYSVLTKLSTN